MTRPPTWPQRLSRLLRLTLAVFAALLMGVMPVRADSLTPPPPLDSPQSRAELPTPQARDAAEAAAREPATLTNNSSHNLGLFARYKKDPADQAAGFFVLAPGHSSDDDYDAVALYLPAQVELGGAGRQPEGPAAEARVVPLLAGENVEVSDLLGDGDGYQLNLPAVAVTDLSPGLAIPPALSQTDLDAAPETAPLD